ncbi:DUF4365 domain-containing protein [Maribellus sediminis]|uniref:DUF4365 domain-containing protein n=1 Tax=Maribellus sediminis TaxID=2696285 RepID=UPI0014308ABB|nr:DUF4365 domain-containing protein [Maribellus sediminis]
MRTYQHIIDTKAVRQVINAIPEYCVVRELTERDYGIDLMIELFKKTGINKHGHDYYDSTGHVCYLQIKGTDNELAVNKNDTISFNIDKKSLYYVEKFSTPFILTRVCTKKDHETIYFIWLQRYISDVLDIETPDWRTEDEESITIYIPTHNDFENNFEKIEKIAYRIKYIEELSEYSEKYTDLTLDLQTIIHLHEKYQYFDETIKDLKRLSQLTTLLTKNNCCIDQDCIIELIKYLEGVKSGINQPAKMEDYPHNYNLELLRTSNLSTKFIEEMEAENEGVTTY